MTRFSIYSILVAVLVCSEMSTLAVAENAPDSRNKSTKYLPVKAKATTADGHWIEVMLKNTYNVSIECFGVGVATDSNRLTHHFSATVPELKSDESLKTSGGPWFPNYKIVSIDRFNIDCWEKGRGTMEKLAARYYSGKPVKLSIASSDTSIVTERQVLKYVKGNNHIKKPLNQKDSSDSAVAR